MRLDIFSPVGRPCLQLHFASLEGLPIHFLFALLQCYYAHDCSCPLHPGGGLVQLITLDSDMSRKKTRVVLQNGDLLDLVFINTLLPNEFGRQHCIQWQYKSFTSYVFVTDIITGQMELEWPLGLYLNGHKVIENERLESLWKNDEDIPHVQMKLPSQIHAEILKSVSVKDGLQPIFIVYVISVQHGEMQWRVKRRFKSFDALHLELMKLNESELPKLPLKTWWHHQERTFIVKRQNELNIYLQNILNLDKIRTSLPLLAFLGAVSTTQYEHMCLTGTIRPTWSLRVLHRYLHAGDIILFQSKNPLSGLQRHLTGSEWDHIGMVVPYPTHPQTLALLEVTGDGVTVLPLTSRLKTYASYHARRIAVRQIHRSKASKEQLTIFHSLQQKRQLNTFVQTVNGSPYSLNAYKLWGASTSVPPDFFCSELIAAALKAIGCIGNSIPPNTFWPVCFGRNGAVEEEMKRQGMTLSPEIIIDCEVPEISNATTSAI